jgi:hypothetical protein
MTKKSTFIQRIMIACLLALTTQTLFAQNICDCDGTSHTPGVLIWLGDTFADDGFYSWEGQPVNFNCATWGYDCGDIVGAPAEDPHGVCAGNLPPNNGCAGNAVFGCTDPLALNYDIDATVDDGSCVFVEGCTNEFANNFNADAVVDDGSCTFDLICDCAGTAHTAGVLSWLGDTFADDGSFNWELQPVDFNCATWGYDCGDIVGAPLDDPYAVCLGNLPPNNGCNAADVFGCTDPTANNYNMDATIDDGSCTYDIAGCTDPLANNYDPFANIEDGSCTYGTCGNFMLDAAQTVCAWDESTQAYYPGVDLTFLFDGGCTVANIYINLEGTEYPFPVDAPANVSGSVFSLTGFPENAMFSAYYVFTDGTASDVYDFMLGDCSQDPLICDCAGTAHTIGVLSWIGDTFADNGAFNWGGQPVDFNCATWGYDCGDIAGAPAEDTYGVCLGNLPPNNGCNPDDVFGCTDPTANNYNMDATVDDGSCTYDVLGCTDVTANNYNPAATVNDGSCTYGLCSNLGLTIAQGYCQPDANDVLSPVVDFTLSFDGGCTAQEIIFVIDGTEFPVALTAPDNVSGTELSFIFAENQAFTVYYVLADGTPSLEYEFVTAPCSQDPLICDCAGTAHTIGVLSWIGDTFADNGTYNWAGQPVDFNCATWGYDCGDVLGAPGEDPNGVCLGNLPPNNGCDVSVVFGCTDPTANNYDATATTDDGSCTYDVFGCTDPTANNYNMDATIDDGSCTYGACSNLVLDAMQMPCTPDANDVLNPAVDFTFNVDGGCTVATLVVVLDGTEYPFDVTAPDNVSGSVFGLTGFPANAAYSAYFTLSDGSVSATFDFATGDCSQDALICDCAGTAHTIGVLSWLGDTFADEAAYNWAGQPVDFNCATWGYDCGDIAGAPAEDPYGVCDGNLPPNNGCAPDDVFGCTDPLANNYNPDATVNDGSCTYDVLGCTDPTANNYNPAANVDDGSCTYGACSNLVLTAEQTYCTQDANGVLNPGVDFTFSLDGGCTITSIVINLDGTDYPFDVVAPDNVSGSMFPVTGFPANSTFTAYYVLADGTQSDVFDFTVGDCSQDPIICDCDGNEHTIGVLDWIGDTFADDGAYTWAGLPVNFNCATWGYDCGDIAGAPAEDPYGVCDGNLPPSNGCGLNVVEVATTMNIEAYPNPTSGMLTLVNRGEGGNKQIRVFDQTGKLQFAEQRAMAAGSSELFNLTALAAGTYHVQVVGNNGVSNITVIVQK